MNKLNKAARLSAAASLLMLAACGGGGGGGPASNIVSNPTGGGSTSNSGGTTSGSGGTTTDTGSSGGSTSGSTGGTTTDPGSTGGGSTSGGSTSGGSTSGGTTTGGTTAGGDGGVFGGDTGGGTGAGTGGDTTPPAPNFATLGRGSTDKNQFGIFTANSAVTVNASGNPTLTAPLAATSGDPAKAAAAGVTIATAPTGLNQTLSSGTQFPLTQTVIQVSGTAIKPANTVLVGGVSPVDGGATLKVTNWNPTGSSDFTLSIPGLGLSGVNIKSFSSSSLLKGASTIPGSAFRLTASNTNYAALGLWEQDANIGNAPTIFLGTFVTGYETPTQGEASMPKTGTATYFGTQNTTAIVTSFDASHQLMRAAVLGDASYSADFGAGSLTGTFSNMQVLAASPAATATPWNSVTVSATIAGNKFNGGATAQAVPGGATSNYTVTPGATGNFNGGFYGPSAKELAGVWSLTDSSHVVIGVATGKQH